MLAELLLIWQGWCRLHRRLSWMPSRLLCNDVLPKNASLS